MARWWWLGRKKEWFLGIRESSRKISDQVTYTSLIHTYYQKKSTKAYNCFQYTFLYDLP